MLDTALDTLYMKAQTGKIKSWNIETAPNADGTAIVRIRHGFVDGKTQIKDRIIKKGKNIGRANETTPFMQAKLEAQSAWNKQIDGGYVLETHGVTDLKLPMLAKPFKANKHRIKYPVIAQPKLNGVRCLAEKVDEHTIDFTSRKAKSYNDTLSHLTPHLLPLMKVGEIFDGEIYVHGWTLQRIVSAVKKLRPDTAELQFRVYDVADESMSNFDRANKYKNAIPRNGGPIRVVDVSEAACADDIKRLHDEWVGYGFEGAILRNPDAKYCFVHRVKDLQKYKEFIDHEFEIIGGYPGEGTHDGCVVFTVRGRAKDKDGKLGPVVEFNAVPKADLERRRKWMAEIDSLIGKDLTVRYFELSEDGVPTGNPVGIAVRDYE